MSDDTVTLRPYQMEDLTFHIANPRSLNLSDPGTGKTPTVCVLIYYWYVEHNWKTVWVQPKSLLYKNRDELLRFTDFKPEDVEVLEVDSLQAKPSEQRSLTAFLKAGKGRIPKRFLKYRRFWPRLAAGDTIDLISESQAKVILCGFRFMARFWNRLLHWGAMAVAVDELHMGYGSHESQNTQSLFAMMKVCEGFVGMTGTLLNGRLDSVYPAIHVIEPRYYGSYGGFRYQHVSFEDEYGRVLAWKNEAKIGQILLAHGVRHTFQEVYGEEPVVYLPDRVEMGEQMREAYDEFAEMAMLELEDGWLDGSLPGVNTIRARQIIAHPETMGLCKDEETAKDERLRIHVQDAIERGDQLLLFSVHVAEQERLVRLLTSMGRRVGLFNSNTSTAERARLDKAFRLGQIDDIVGSPETMAVGWNWEHVNHVIFVSMDYTDVTFLQAYRRASRGTRTTTLRVTIMLYEDSIDYRVLDINYDKSVIANKVDSTRPVLTWIKDMV